MLFRFLRSRWPLATPVSPTGRGAAAAAPGPEEEIMLLPKFIEIDGKRHAWRDLVQRRREQLLACTRAE